MYHTARAQYSDCEIVTRVMLPSSNEKLQLLDPNVALDFEFKSL